MTIFSKDNSNKPFKTLPAIKQTSTVKNKIDQDLQRLDSDVDSWLEKWRKKWNFGTTTKTR